MKKFDIIVLNNDELYTEFNLTRGMHGIVIDKTFDKLEVLFFNPSNYGETVVVWVAECDVSKEQEVLPENLLKELVGKIDIIKRRAKENIELPSFKQYDMVELLVEEKRYSKHGIHKGDTGCIMENFAVNGYVEVDFSGIDENGDFQGDFISVKLEDLKIINKK
ncbi:MAG: hypothetical protein E7378_02510 [Clostridiales bacterium]|nr:hypothetical protein [Clostridiales bacterium]